MDIRQFKTTGEDNTIFAIIHCKDYSYPWVVSKVTSHSLSFGEWCNGSYFKTYGEALKCFDILI